MVLWRLVLVLRGCNRGPDSEPARPPRDRGIRLEFPPRLPFPPPRAKPVSAIYIPRPPANDSPILWNSKGLGSSDYVLSPVTIPSVKGLHRICKRFTTLCRPKIADARNAIEHASALLRPGGDVSVRLSVEIEAARLLAASGNPTDYAAAERNLQGALADATKEGLAGLQLQTRLALGEIEMKASASAAGRARLFTLEKDAREKGFLLIARKARATAAK